jgi:site-specific DNA recombinase
MTTALYARVSTAQQERQGTIESQLAALAAYAAAHDLTIAPEHRYVDEGVSGARLDRPGLDRLRDAAWRGELARVLILAPDRLARHYAYQYVVIEELERAGCAVIFVTGPAGTSPEERLVREVHGLFAEFERAAFRERGRRGKLHAARTGGFFTGVGAYGYTYLPSDGRGGTGVVNAAEAAVVRQVFAWLIEDHLSVAAIARRLTEQGVPTRHGGPAWSPATVHRIVTSRRYTGEHHSNRTELAPEDPGARYRRPTKEPRRRPRPAGEWIRVPWPAIIDAETFAMAERQLQLNRERSPRKMRHRYLLSGLLVCGGCGRRLGGHAGVASGRYECTRRRSDEPPERRCRLRAVCQRDIEPVVWEHVRALLDRPELILAYLREQQAGEGPALTEAQRELKRAERQRATLAREEQRLLDAYQVGALELDELTARRQRLRDAGQRLDARAELVGRQVVQAHRAATLAETVTSFCERIRAQLATPTFEVKQKVLRLVVERIVVTDDQIVIEHVIPGEGTSRLRLRPGRAREQVGGPHAGAAVGGAAAGPRGGRAGLRALAAPAERDARDDRSRGDPGAGRGLPRDLACADDDARRPQAAAPPAHPRRAARSAPGARAGLGPDQLADRGHDPAVDPASGARLRRARRPGSAAPASARSACRRARGWRDRGYAQCRRLPDGARAAVQRPGRMVPAAGLGPPTCGRHAARCPG